MSEPLTMGDRIDLLYGREGLTLTLPSGVRATIVRKPPMPLLADPEDAVARALDRGMAGEVVHQGLRGARSACILVCDVTRPVPNHLFLRPLIERLLAQGIDREAITVLVATGLHRPNLGDELAEVLGDPWVQANVRVVNHEARRDADHKHVGTTSRGTVVRLDRRFVEADLRIATGLVEPHFMAGYSGGRKVIAPGVAHAETITTFHNHAFMSHPLAAPCVLEGNPLHEDQLEIVGMIGGALALNTVIDEARSLAFVSFGEVEASHLEAVDFVQAYTRVSVPRAFRTVVTTSAGHPLDKTWYQTVKGLVGALDIVQEGGDLIIASECSEGLGSEAFARSQARYLSSGRDRFLAEIAARDHAEIDEWQTHKQAAPAEHARVSLLAGGLDDEAIRLTGVEPIESLEAAVAASVARHGDTHIAVIPEGPYVVPSVTPAGSA